MDPELVALAAEDFVPVILSALGFAVLARLAADLDRRAGRLVWGGGALVVLGGITKPIYKSLLALSSGTVDVLVLDDVLFWLLAPGFVVAGAGLRAAARRDAGLSASRGTRALWLAGATVAAGAALAVGVGGRAWFLLLLTVATVGNVWVVVVLVRWATARDERVAATLFVANIVIVFGLAWAAAALPQTIPVIWGQQLASSVAQGLFLWGAVRLSRVAAPAPATT